MGWLSRPKRAAPKPAFDEWEVVPAESRAPSPGAAPPAPSPVLVPPPPPPPDRAAAETQTVDDDAPPFGSILSVRMQPGARVACVVRC